MGLSKLQSVVQRLKPLSKVPRISLRFYCERSTKLDSSPKLSSAEKANLQNAIQLLKTDIRHSLWLLKIENSDAYLPHDFSSAFCNVTRSAARGPSGLGTVYNFAGIFVDGLKLLQGHLDNPDKLTLEPAEKLAIHNLYDCLQNIEELSDKLGSLCTVARFETIWRIPLLHHLLSRLAVKRKYVIEEVSRDHPHVCNCCGEEITGSYGDNSMGNLDVWHGSADVLLGLDEVAVNFITSEVYYVEDTSSSDEIEYFQRPTDYRGRIFSQTLVFGCLQKQICPSLKHYLIPTIAISRSLVKFFFYDPEKDVLMESAPFDLFVHDGVNYSIPYSTVLALWLCINYKHLSSGVPVTMLKDQRFRANFLTSLLERTRKIYTNKLSLGDCHDVVPDHEYRPDPEGNVKMVEFKF